MCRENWFPEHRPEICEILGSENKRGKSALKKSKNKTNENIIL